MKRGDNFIMRHTDAVLNGAAVRFVRMEGRDKGKTGNVVVALLFDAPSKEGSTYFPAGTEIITPQHALIHSARQSKQKKSGSYLLLCACHGCGYKIRATGYWLGQAVPSCPMPNDACPDSGKQMDVEWEPGSWNKITKG